MFRIGMRAMLKDFGYKFLKRTTAQTVTQMHYLIIKMD